MYRLCQDEINVYVSRSMFFYTPRMVKTKTNMAIPRSGCCHLFKGIT